MKQITQKVIRLLGSRQCTYAVLIFFVIEAVWVACSAIYPMAFDEDFHLGIIKIYAHHWSPFLTSQPDGTSQFGAVARDPSYLYHWMMSFPYRFITALTSSQTAQVIFLRLINVGLFGLGLVLFRKVLARAQVSRPLANTILAIFVLVPIVPLLAGQINYDNLLFPITAALALLAYSALQDFVARKVRLKTLAWLAALAMLGSLVKYAFLPIVLGAALFLCVALIRAFWGHWRELWTATTASFRLLSRRAKIGLLLLLLLSGTLFVQRYGINFATYHTPVPACESVLSTDDCMSYGPWARNYAYEQAKGDVSTNPWAYTWTWLQSMHYRLFFTVNGPASDFMNYPPVPIPSAAAITIGVFSVMAVLCYWRRVFRGNPYLLFLLVISLSYIVVLWLDNFNQYTETGQPVAINGRYLLLTLIPLGAIFGKGLSIALRAWPRVKAFVAVGAIVLFLQGGGVLGFILRSDDSWYWHSSIVVHFNNAARDVLRPPIIEGNKRY